MGNDTPPTDPPVSEYPFVADQCYCILLSAHVYPFVCNDPSAQTGLCCVTGAQMNDYYESGGDCTPGKTLCADPFIWLTIEVSGVYGPYGPGGCTDDCDFDFWWT